MLTSRTNKVVGDFLFGKLVDEHILDESITDCLDRADYFLTQSNMKALKYIKKANNLYNDRYNEAGDNYDINHRLNQTLFTFADIFSDCDLDN